MARPKKNISERRDRRMNLRFTDAEIEQLFLEADKAGLAPYEYARRLALRHRVTPITSNRIDPALINELNRIGVNLNQLTKFTHLGKDTNGHVERALGDLRHILAEVMASHAS